MAAPVLRALGRRLGPDREVILVPGNHDRAIVAPWILRMGDRLSVDSPAPLDATPELAAVSSWLAPAQVSTRNPQSGVWLSYRCGRPMATTSTVTSRRRRRSASPAAAGRHRPNNGL